ncbi:MAG: DegT/DnrJ/EryC1/StrS family aminotransferase [Janthinobacterium lividum]
MTISTSSSPTETTKAQEFLPFAKPWISEEAIAEVVDCLRSGWITTGPRVQKFEEMLRAYCGSSYALTMSSATAGLFLALKALKLKPEDEVITTPMTFVCTANVIVQAGAKPVFADIEQGTHNIDIGEIAKAITPRTKAIMPVHFHGLPVDLDPLYALAKQYNLRVIEDAAHAIGTEYKGQRIGSFGDTQVFSFHPNKNMTTGEGGCVTTRDERLVHAMTLNRFHGIDRAAWNRHGKSGSQHYDVIEPGFKFNMMDMQAAVGIHQLPVLDNAIEKRTQLAQRYSELLENWDEIILPQAPFYAHKHAWHQYGICVVPEKAGLTRDDFIEAMKEYNIGTGLQYCAAHLYSFYRNNYGFNLGDFPVAEKVGQTIVSLPLFPQMSMDDQDRVIHAMKSIFKKR